MTEPTTQSSQGQDSQSSQGQGQSAAGSSGQTTSSASGSSGSTQTTQVSARPEWAPESAWKSDTGLDHEAFGRHFNEKINPVLVRDAAEQVRRGALPQNADAYQAKTSPAFQVPQGVEFALDANDPLWPQAKAWAKEAGLSQEQFEKGIDLIAGRDLFNQQQVQTAVKREIEKLGPTAASRVDAIETFWKGLLGEQPGKAMMSRIFNAGDVQMHEKIISKFATQGHASFSTAHREPGGPQGRVSDEEYSRMTPGERFNYARQFDQTQVQRNGTR